MLVYFITLFVVVLAAYVARKSRSALISHFFLSIGFMSMVLVAGMRDRTVGTDTGEYVRFFYDIRTFADVLTFGNNMGEYGFWLLTWILHCISSQYGVFLLAIALIVVACYQSAIVTYSRQIEVSFFIFIAMGFYTFFFNGARQGIACAIYSLAIGPLLKRSFAKYLAFVVLAFFFHKTAIMMIPVYFIFNRPNTVKNILLIVVIGFAAAMFYDNIVEMASRVDIRYMDARAAGEGGGYYVTAFAFALGAFFLIFKGSVRIDRGRYDRLLNMFIFGIMIGLVSSALSVNPSGLLRYSFYFNIAAVFLWPIVFRNITDRFTKLFVGYFFVVGYLVFFAMTTERFSDLVPYKFNLFPLVSSH